MEVQSVAQAEQSVVLSVLSVTLIDQSVALKSIRHFGGIIRRPGRTIRRSAVSIRRPDVYPSFWRYNSVVQAEQSVDLSVLSVTLKDQSVALESIRHFGGPIRHSGRSIRRSVDSIRHFDRTIRRPEVNPSFRRYFQLHPVVTEINPSFCQRTILYLIGHLKFFLYFNKALKFVNSMHFHKQSYPLKEVLIGSRFNRYVIVMFSIG